MPNIDEEREKAKKRMIIRKNTHAIRASLKQSSVDIKGIGESKNLMTLVKCPKGDASKVDIHKPNKYGFYTDDKGLLMCSDISNLQDESELEELQKLAKEEKRSIEDIRFDRCNFPKGKDDREFILTTNKFKDLKQLQGFFKNKWLFLHGSVGRGKTARAIRIMWEEIEPRYFKKVTFLPIGPWINSQMPIEGEITDREQLIRNRLRSINGENTENLVILDDFDKFKTQSPYQSNHLFNLIDDLKNRDCKVIITSNSSIRELESNCNEKLLPVMDRIKSKSFSSFYEGDSLR